VANSQLSARLDREDIEKAKVKEARKVRKQEHI
jgi:hypothetical protein